MEDVQLDEVQLSEEEKQSSPMGTEMLISDEPAVLEGDEHSEEEAPTEILLTQVLEQANGLPIEEPEERSAPHPVSQHGALADEMDTLAEAITSGNVSPHEAASAVRAMTAATQDSGLPSTEPGVQPASSKPSEESEGVVGPGQGWKGDSEVGLEDVSLTGTQEEEAAVASAETPPATKPKVPSDLTPSPAAERSGGSSGGGGSSSSIRNLVRQFESGAAMPVEEDEAQQQQDRLAAAEVTALAAESPQQQELSAANYQSRLMQQLTASEEDDLTVYRSSDIDVAAQSANTVLRNPTVGLAAGAAQGPAAAAASGSAAVERFEIDAAMGATPPATTADAAAEAQANYDIWEQTFKGLLYVDGVDTLGRPVVVINADAVPKNMKSSALVYCKSHLEPVVNKGQYVLVFTAKKAALPSMWIMGAYRTLPRPYRKNVQYIILVRPSGFLRAVLAFMRPLVSKKVGRKIKKVDSLREIGEATGGEVTLQHLGSRFLAEVATQE